MWDIRRATKQKSTNLGCTRKYSNRYIAEQLEKLSGFAFDWRIRIRQAYSTGCARGPRIRPKSKRKSPMLEPNRSLSFAPAAHQGCCNAQEPRENVTGIENKKKNVTGIEEQKDKCDRNGTKCDRKRRKRKKKKEEEEQEQEEERMSSWFLVFLSFRSR